MLSTVVDERIIVCSSAVVHISGGMAALICTVMVGPRIGAFNKEPKPRSGMNILLGTFILWFANCHVNHHVNQYLINTRWSLRSRARRRRLTDVIGACRFGWFAFNSASTVQLSDGRWVLASRAALVTIVSSISGGVFGVIVRCVSRFVGRFMAEKALH